MTYGTPTTLPWGVDFGDGVPRHPVQLYEAATMAIFLAVFVLLLRQGRGDGAAHRVLRVRRGLCGPAVCLGILEALRHGGRTAEPVSSAFAGPRSLRPRFCLPGVAPAMPISPAAADLSRPAIAHRDAAQAPALHLSRPDHLAVRDLPRSGAGEDHRGGWGGLLPEALRRARRPEDAGVERGELLEAVPRFLETRRCAAQIPYPHRQGLSLRLRPVPRPRAAQLPRHHRGQRALQPYLPDLLCQLLAGEGRAAQPRADRGHARSPGRERGATRPPADLRRRADAAPADPRHHPRRAQPPDPARDAEHQRPPASPATPILSPRSPR